MINFNSHSMIAKKDQKADSDLVVKNSSLNLQSLLSLLIR